jgi:hypothetical protein
VGVNTTPRTVDVREQKERKLARLEQNGGHCVGVGVESSSSLGGGSESWGGD